MMFPPDGCQEKEEPRDSFFRGFFRLELSLYQGVTKTNFRTRKPSLKIRVYEIP